MTHGHDEAMMRLKSYGHEATTRGRISKIQNQSVHIYAGETSNYLFTELHPLYKKDANTIAYTLILVATEAFETILRGSQEICGQNTRARIIHLVVGDGINTNDNACRRVFAYFEEWARKRDVRYSMVVVKCASHKANLVVQVAICGRVIREPVKNNALVGTCSRLFQYLVVDYLDEFSYNWRRHIEATLNLVHEHAG